MAIQDSNSERRNLSLLSLCIVVYYAAGGHLADETVRLQIINVSFSKPVVLVYFIWSILFWFCFRYWLLNHNNYKESLFIEMDSTTVSLFFYKYLVSRFGLSSNFSNSYYQDRHWVKVCKSAPPGIKFQHTYKAGTGHQQNEFIEIETIADKFHLIGHAVIIAFCKPTISGYFTPYVLFLAAILLGLKDWL